MSKNKTAKSKDDKLKAALRDNLKKRKQFARSLGNSADETEASGIKLRSREISAKDTK